MQSNKRISLRTKLAFFATLLVIVVAASISTYLRSAQQRTIQDEQTRMQEEMVRALRTVTQNASVMNDETTVVNYLNLLKKQDFIDYAMILSPQGKILVHTTLTMIGQSLTDPVTIQALNHQQKEAPLEQTYRNAEGEGIIDMSLPVFTSSDPHTPIAVARIGFNKSEIDKQISSSLHEVDRQIVYALILALVLGFVGSSLLALFITRPLERLRRGAQLIGEGKLDHRIQVETQDELKELAEEFNLMGEKLAELDRMKQDFVSNVTHELRSPLTSLRGYIDLLLKGAGGDVSELQKDYLSIIKNNSVRLSRFIDNLLDVAKIEAHKLKLIPEEQDVFELAHEMGVLFKPQMDEKKIRFVNGVPHQGLIAFVDKDKLAEVLINLASNAIKFTPENGSVTIGAREEAKLIRMSVEDTGIGIPGNMLEKVFNKFEQVKRTEGMARNQKGTGLGLTIVKGIIESHGGKIWVDSPGPSGKGSIFYFTLPKVTGELKAKLRGDA